MITRLFDIISQRKNEAPNAPMLAAKNASGVYETLSCKEVWDAAKLLAGGLKSLQIATDVADPERQEKIAIISLNRPEWIITDVACQLSGTIITPIYPTASPHDVAFILNESKVRILFIENAEMLKRFKAVLPEVPTLQHVISFEETEDAQHWKTLTGKGLELTEADATHILPHSIATIIYTSGTTGDPKGVMLSHQNIVSNVDNCMPVFSFADEGERALSFLPLNHIFEKMVSYVYLRSGIAIYYAEGMETIGENLREVQPIVFTTVPRLLEKVYERILGKGMELTGIKRKLFFWALELGKQFDNRKPGSLWYQLQLKLANKIIFNKWREALGGKVRAIVTGSAACQERLIRIFSAAGIVIMEGYGLTETSPVVSVNRFESEDRMMGTIGTLINNVQAKLAEDGEILVQGENVMAGYYKRPDLTAEAMKDGWFHTGDIGQWVDDKFLKITDRKKEIFKTSGGKYVSPQVIENKMKESVFMEQIMVIGANRKFVSALIVPAFSTIEKYLRDRKIEVPTSHEELVKMKEVKALIRKQLDKYNEAFNHVEQVKLFTLLDAAWTINSGELTPTLKVRRKVVEARYEKEIEGMYD